MGANHGIARITLDGDTFRFNKLILIPKHLSMLYLWVWTQSYNESTVKQSVNLRKKT